MWPDSPNFALIKKTIMIDFLFKSFTIRHPIYTSLGNANNTWTDKTVTV